MNPSIPNRFPWENVETDIHGLAQYFGIDLGPQAGRPASSYPTGSHPNLEPNPSSDHDTLNHSARHEHADYVSPSTSGYSPNSVPPPYPEHGDFPDQHAIGGSALSIPRYGGSAAVDHSAPQHYGYHDHPNYPQASPGSFDLTPYYGTTSSVEHSAPQQYGYNDHPNYPQPSPGSFDFNPLYGTTASAEPSSSRQYGYNDYPNYPHASSGSFESPPRYGTTASGEFYASQQYGHNDDPTYRDPALDSSYSHPLYETSASAETSSPQRYEPNSASYDPTEDQGYPIPAQMRDNSLSPNHVYEPARISHSQDMDHATLQELQESLALPFPRFLAPGFDASILSQCFRAFSRVKKETILKCELLGNNADYLNKQTMSNIFEAKRGKGILIEKFNTIMTRNGIGKIETVIPKTFYRFIKGENFHFVDIFCEANAKISQDFRIHDIPIVYLQIIAMLYGKRALSPLALSKMLGLAKDTVKEKVPLCNRYLTELNSPVKIASSNSENDHSYYLTIDSSENIG